MTDEELEFGRIMFGEQRFSDAKLGSDANWRKLYRAIKFLQENDK